MDELRLPYNFKPRPYQRAFMDAMDRGTNRAILVWNRRSGKDTVCAHQACKMAFQRVGTYFHMLPTTRQARKVVWEAIDKKGKRMIDAVFPHEIRSGEPNSTEMMIPLRSGSRYQCVGSDNYDALVGTNPVGVIFSEFALADPRAFDFIRPILRENDGWAVFPSTPRGLNHFKDLYELAKNDPSWFVSHKTVDETGTVTLEDLEEERRSGMPEELIQQEYYCSFTSTNVGSVFGRYLENADKEGRISPAVKWNPDGGPVIASLDIGFHDSTACWFWQIFPDRPVLIDFEEASGLDAPDWIELLKNKPYEYERIYLPHDAKAKTFQTRFSAQEQFIASGLPTALLPQMRIPDRINAARTIFPICVFQRDLCANGLRALRSWEYKWNDDLKVFSKTPAHTWASHAGDSFTYGATVVALHYKKLKPAETAPQEGAGAHYTFSLESLFSSRDNNFSRIRERV